MKFKSAIFGFIAGAVTVATLGTAIGADTVVVGTLKPNISFKIDGNITKAPHSMTPINYNGYTYVPVRYISEMLGCNVEWNAYGDMVIVDFPEDRIKEVVREVEKIVYVNNSDDVDGNVYDQIPLTKRTSDFTVDITAYKYDETFNISEVYLTFESKDHNGVLLNQDDTCLIVDGEKYSISKRVNRLDNNWNNYIRDVDGAIDGYLAFDNVPKDAKAFTLQLVTIKDGTTSTTKINFAK